MNDDRRNKSEAVAGRPPLLREKPCECGEPPLLINGVYVCTNPACDGYGQVCSAP